MEFARKVWKVLVAVKDGLALLVLLMFFGLLYAVLSARPGVATMTSTPRRSACSCGPIA